MTPALARIVTDALRGGDRPVIGGPGVSLGAREILDRADTIRKNLDRLGIAPDEPILVSVANRGADIAAFLSVWLAGAVVVPLHATAPAAVRDGLIADTGIRLHLDGENGALHAVAATPPPERQLLSGAALVIFTSGSTGTPKGVVIGHDRLAGKLTVLNELLRPTPGTRLLLPLQLTFIFGIWLALLIIGAGGRVTLVSKFTPAGIGEALKGDITMAAFVPTMLRALLIDSGSLPAAPSLRQLLTGGELFGEALAHQVADVWPNAGVFDLYGLTETGSCDFCRKPEDPLSSIGHPTSGVTYRIRIEPGLDAGELQISSPFGMLGYLNRPELTAASFADGWFRTGDLARQRPDGAVELVGRSTEIVSRGGNKIAPLEIDRLFNGHPDVAAALATGVPDPVVGERLHVMVVPRPGARLDADALRSWAAERVEKFKLPDRIHIGPELPPGPTGKADRRALRQRIQNADG